MREQHPIEGLMITAMNSIKDMIDVNTIIGEPIETTNNIIIIPISKVGLGFASGGSEFKGETIDEYTRKDKEEEIQYRLPFGGGSGAGVSISPVAFLVVQQNNVKLLPVDHISSIDRLLDYVPDLVEKLNDYLNTVVQNKKETKSKSKEKGKQLKQNLDDISEKVAENITTKTKPKRNIKPKTELEEIEYEYDETIDENEDE